MSFLGSLKMPDYFSFKSKSKSKNRYVNQMLSSEKEVIDFRAGNIFYLFSMKKLLPDFERGILPEK